MAKTEIKAWMYDVLKKPVITEKSTYVAENGKIVFQVAQTATKKDIKEAVEAIFKAKVKDVNIVNTYGKSKRFRGKMGARQDIKKAYVSVVDGQNIDFTNI